VNKKESHNQERITKGVDGTLPGIDKGTHRKHLIKSIPGLGRSSRALDSAMRGLLYLVKDKLYPRFTRPLI